jgi:hypothetical protein
MNTTTVPKSRRLHDAMRSFGEKLARWRTQPKASLRLVTVVMLLLLLVVAVASMGQALTEWHPDLHRFAKTIQEYWEYDRS